MSPPYLSQAARRRALPAYTYGEAARLLQMSHSTLRSWFAGQKGFQPVIALSDPGIPALSFDNLVEAHVLAAIRRKHGLALQRVRRALEYTIQSMRVDRPLINQQFETNGVDLFVEQLDGTVNASQGGQLAMDLRARLDRIERDDHGMPIKLFPFVRSSDEPDDTRLIVIDPELAFGRPAIARLGVATDVIADRVKAGESIASVADDFGARPEEIEEALRCELRRAA